MKNIMKLASIGLVLLFTLFGLTNKASAAKLTLYCSVEIDVCEMLEQAYEKETGTKVAMTRASSGETFAKIKAESSNPNGDVWFGGTGLYSSIKGSKKPFANLFNPMNNPSGTPIIIPKTNPKKTLIKESQICP